MKGHDRWSRRIMMNRTARETAGARTAPDRPVSEPDAAWSRAAVTGHGCFLARVRMRERRREG